LADVILSANIHLKVSPGFAESLLKKKACQAVASGRLLAMIDWFVRYGREEKEIAEIAVRRRAAAVQLEAQIRLDRTSRVSLPSFLSP
jgi:hypothetical protein